MGAFAAQYRMNISNKILATLWFGIYMLGSTLLSLPCMAERVSGDSYATWGIKSSNLAIPVGSVITEAVLTVKGVSPVDAPFEVYLLNNPKPGYTQIQKDMAGSMFAGHGARLMGTTVGGDYICRLGDFQNNNDQSSVWDSFKNPFNIILADGRAVRYTSALLELVDYTGSGGSFGIGIETSQINSLRSFALLSH